MKSMRLAGLGLVLLTCAAPRVSRGNDAVVAGGVAAAVLGTGALVEATTGSSLKAIVEVYESDGRFTLDEGLAARSVMNQGMTLEDLQAVARLAEDNKLASRFIGYEEELGKIHKGLSDSKKPGAQNAATCVQRQIDQIKKLKTALGAFGEAVSRAEKNDTPSARKEATGRLRELRVELFVLRQLSQNKAYVAFASETLQTEIEKDANSVTVAASAKVAGAQASADKAGSDAESVRQARDRLARSVDAIREMATGAQPAAANGGISSMVAALKLPDGFAEKVVKKPEEIQNVLEELEADVTRKETTKTEREKELQTAKGDQAIANTKAETARRQFVEKVHLAPSDASSQMAGVVFGAIEAGKTLGSVPRNSATTKEDASNAIKTVPGISEDTAGKLASAQSQLEVKIVIEESIAIFAAGKLADDWLNQTYSTLTSSITLGPIRNEVLQMLFTPKAIQEICNDRNESKWHEVARVSTLAGPGNHNVIIYLENLATPVLKSDAYNPSAFIEANGAMYRRAFSVAANVLGASVGEVGTAGTTGTGNLAAIKTQAANTNKAADEASNAVLKTMAAMIDAQKSIADAKDDKVAEAVAAANKSIKEVAAKLTPTASTTSP